MISAVRSAFCSSSSCGNPRCSRADLRYSQGGQTPPFLDQTIMLDGGVDQDNAKSDAVVIKSWENIGRKLSPLVHRAAGSELLFYNSY